MHYDLTIIGGGLVGAGLATALRTLPLRIALVDARLPSSEDPRLFALNYPSCQFLHNIGIWPQLQAYVSPIHQVHVSHHGHFGSVSLAKDDVNLANLGHVIPARFLEEALNNLLVVPVEHCTCYRPATLTALQSAESGCMLKIITEKGEQTIQSRVVIGADGTDSTLRSLVNLPTKIIDYKQTAIVTRTKLKRSHQHIAYERFYTNGALAMLPLAENECATIWTLDQAESSHLMACSDELFLQALQKTFGYRLGRLQSISQRHSFPLRLLQAEQTVKQSVLLLGNAAHTMSPIAAQGFNLALYEVAVLAEFIRETISQNKIFSAADLPKISEQIQQQQTISILLSHRLAQLFANRSILINMGLSLGMIGLNTLTSVKRKFIENLMGKRGRIPRLLLQ